jgi:hypothetical protein
MTKPPVALFIFSNDIDKSLNLENEQSNINNTFRYYDDNNILRCKVEFQVTIEKLFELFDFYKGRIALLHFAGHADGKGLHLDNHAKVEGLSMLFKREVENGQLQFVFLNGCSTIGQVKLLREANVPSIIATNCSVTDLKAIRFSNRFYEALTNINGQATLKEAFENGKTRLLTDSTRIKKLKEGLLLRNKKKSLNGNFILIMKTGYFLIRIYLLHE